MELCSLPGNNFLKTSVLQTYAIINKFDVVCIPKTYFNFLILSNDKNLDLPGFMSADHQSNKNQTVFAFISKIAFL